MAETVDEAGMLDQDTAHALLSIADETGARVALVGDRHLEAWQPVIDAPCQQVLGGPQRGGLARTGRALNDHELAVTGQGADDRCLGGGDSRQSAATEPHPPDGSLGPPGETTHEIVLDRHDVLRGQ